jgi:hypothetical protein
MMLIEQSVLGPLLLDVALIQHSRRNVFAHMVHMLETAMQNGMADTLRLPGTVLL